MVRRERRAGSGRVSSLDANETRQRRLSPRAVRRSARRAFFFRLVFITGEGERARARRLRAHVTVARFCDIRSSSYTPRVTNDTRVRSMKEDCAAVYEDRRSRCESTHPIETSTSIDFTASFRFFRLATFSLRASRRRRACFRRGPRRAREARLRPPAKRASPALSRRRPA